MYGEIIKRHQAERGAGNERGVVNSLAASQTLQGQQWICIFDCVNKIMDTFTPLRFILDMALMTLAFLISGMTIPEEDADVGQSSKYCLVAIGRLQVRKSSQPFWSPGKAYYCKEQEPVGLDAFFELLCPQYRWVLCLALWEKDEAESGRRRGAGTLSRGRQKQAVLASLRAWVSPSPHVRQLLQSWALLTSHPVF